MKYRMKSLQHNGVYVPQYEPKGLSIKIQGQSTKLSPKTEKMAIFWVKKKQSVTSPPDGVFYKNFIEDFLNALKSENPSANHLGSFVSEYLNRLDADSNEMLPAQGLGDERQIDFCEVEQDIMREQQKKEGMTKEEKKLLSKQRKIKREALREKYGYAVVDGQKLEIANWTAEPSCIFAGRGDHPKRGKWKEGPTEEDVTLNLSPESPKPSGN